MKKDIFDVSDEVYKDYGKDIPEKIIGEKVELPKKDSYKMMR